MNLRLPAQREARSATAAELPALLPTARRQPISQRRLQGGSNVEAVRAQLRGARRHNAGSSEKGEGSTAGSASIMRSSRDRLTQAFLNRAVAGGGRY